MIDEVLTVRKKSNIRTVSISGALKTMTKSPLKRVAPATVNRTVTMPRRKPNSVYRTREHLTGAEVDRLIDATKANRWGHRDATMILVAFRHGLRSSELVDLRWDQIDFTHAVLHVHRAKKGTPATHPVVGDEMRALRKLQREQAKAVRDELANELADLYPGFAQKLVELLARVVVNDREIEYINKALPSGADRLLVTELKARGLPWVVNNVETPRITDQLNLPPWLPRSSYLWPPRK